MRVSLRSDSRPSTGKRWCVAVRTAPVCRERIPLEAQLSFPIPDKGGLRFFHMLSPRDRDGRVSILSRIRATVPVVRITELHTAEDGPLFADLPNQFDGRSQKYDAAAQEALFDTLPQLVDHYCQPIGVSLGRQYWDALESIAGVDLARYYRALNPEFFDWLR